MAKQQPKEEPNQELEYPIENIPIEQEYLELANQVPAKTVEMPSTQENQTNQTATGNAKTITQAMDDATDLTDMQFAMTKLFPKDVICRDVMIGRIAPDAFLS